MSEAPASRSTDAGGALPAPREPEAEVVAQGGGGGLRLADQEALVRTFRGLARTQDGLLQHLERVEARRRRALRWLIGGVAVGSLALGGLLALLLRPFLEAPAPVPEIVVQPAPVEVSVPEGSAGPEVVAALRDEIRELRAAREQDREAIRILTTRLLEEGDTALATLQLLEKRLASGPAGAGSAGGGTAEASTDDAPPGESPAGASPSGEGAEAGAGSAPEAGTWLAVLNDLLGMDGYPTLRFREGRRVPGEPELKDVVLLEWNEQGLLDGVVKARRAVFSLQRMSGTLTIRLEDGHRTRHGLRVPLAQEGERLTLTGISQDAWLAHWPELAGSGVDSPPLPVPKAELERVRQALDGLLSMRASYGYYRLAALGGIEGTRLRYVQVRHHDQSGLLLRVYEADSMEVRLHGDGTVELLLEQGAFVEGGLRRPFFRDRFRLFLPRQPLEDWRAAGIPYVEVDAR